MTLEQRREEEAENIKRQTGAREVRICMADDMHPYNCDGMFGGRCIHCERVVEDRHNPETCALCNWDKDI